MFRNYIAVALRNLINHKLYSAINIIGLAVGISACLLIALFVRDELSYDGFWADSDRIYRLHTSFQAPGRAPSVSVQAPGPVAAQLKEYFGGEIKYSTRFTEMDAVIEIDGAAYNQGIHWTDPDTAKIFPLELVAGDLAGALADKASLAVSEEFARRHFGDAAALDRTLTATTRGIAREFRIAAIFKNLPQNSVLAFDVLARIDERDFPGRFDGWTSVAGQLFFKLGAGASIADVSAQFDDFTNRHADLGDAAIEGAQPADVLQFSPMLLKDLHLNAAGWGEMKAPGDKTTVAIVAAIASLILLIAGINFANLSVARSIMRAREVALRKVAGARRSQLMVQFLGESVLIALIALLLGLVLVDIVLPLYSDFLGRDLVAQYDLMAAFSATVAALAVGLLGGVYPAIVLSGYLPSKILKANRSVEATGAASLRHILVIMQFTISAVLIIATIVVYGQLSLVGRADRGFEPKGLLVLQGTRASAMRDQQAVLRNQILALPGVESAAFSWRVPGRGGGSTNVELSGGGSVGVDMLGRGFDFLEAYGIELVAGRDFSPAYVADGIPVVTGSQRAGALVGTVVVNETAARRFGFKEPEKAVGATISMRVKNAVAAPLKASLTIVGVAKDAHFYSLKGEIQPQVHDLVTGGAPYLSVRVTGDKAVVSAQIKEIWQRLAPAIPFSLVPAEQLLASDFAAEKSFGVLMTVFALLAVFVACLGLYGLASFSTERRIKEIGIRKILGAGIAEIVRLLVWQFSKPVIIANMISWPLAIWLMLGWLEAFAYRLDGWILVPACLVSGLLALVVAWVTVGGNAAKVARANPIKALRYE